jgi:transposase-like protein
MYYSLLQELSIKSKTGLVKRQLVELYRSGICTEKQILDAAGISRNLLRRWNRYYQRFRNRRRIVGPKLFCFMKKNVNELAALKRKMAELEQHNQKLQLENEALVTMINLAEQQFKIPIRKKSGPKQ